MFACLRKEKKWKESVCILKCLNCMKTFDLFLAKKSGLKFILCMTTWNISIHSFDCIFINLQSQVFKWYKFSLSYMYKIPARNILLFIWKRKIARDILLKKLNIHAILKEMIHRISWGLFKCMELTDIHVFFFSLKKIITSKKRNYFVKYIFLKVTKRNMYITS